MKPFLSKEGRIRTIPSLLRMARTWLHLWSTSIRWSRSSRLRRKRKVQILVQHLAGSRRTCVGCWMTGNDLLGMIWDDLVGLGQDLATWSLVDEQFSSWFLLQRVKLDTEGPAGCYQSGEEIRRGRGCISCFFLLTSWKCRWEANEQDRILFIGCTSRLASKNLTFFSLKSETPASFLGTVGWRFLKIYMFSAGHLQMV